MQNMSNDPNKQPDQKNLILAVVLSMLILGVFHFTYERPRVERLEAERALQEQLLQAQPDIPQNEHQSAVDNSTPQNRQDIIAQNKRIEIQTSSLKGSLSVTGARIDDLMLNDYFVTLEKEHNVTLLSPAPSEHGYYAESGWLTSNPALKLPDDKTVWRTDNNGNDAKLTPQSPVTLFWDNGQGLRFEKTIEIDDNFLFSITDKVINTSNQTQTVFPYALISRKGIPTDLQNFFILHEGALGYLNGELQEYDYDDLSDNALKEYDSKGGWIGITDKYWLTALLADKPEDIKARFIGSGTQGSERFQTDLRGNALTVQAGQTVENTVHVFAGAKTLSLLDAYEEKIAGADHFDLAIDFGWFYFLTKPFFYVLDFINGYVGSFGIAILLFTVLLRLCVFPLANKSYRSMARLKIMAPKMQEIKERCGNDKVKLQQEIMQLYQKESVNPFSGCLPMLIQIPIFFSLYKVLFVTLEMRQADFYGWINDLSQPDPTSFINVFGLLPFDPPSFLIIGAWPCIMALTMALQQRLNPAPTDPIHASMMAWFPVVLMVILANFPAGLVIYWAWNNVLAIIQQAIIMKTMGVEVNLFKRPDSDAAANALKAKIDKQKTKSED